MEHSCFTSDFHNIVLLSQDYKKHDSYYSNALHSIRYVVYAMNLRKQKVILIELL